MDDIQKIMPVTTVKKNILNIIKEISEDDSTVTVTKNGVAVSVMMSPDRYIGLMETIEILSNPDIMKALNSSRGNFLENKTYSHNDVWSE
ncbi:MAG: type II toxin-antitoxin system Phd/YefM family antitoxin [Desulfobacteraceae bacterium]|jgi:PHD/YefM family antitoxin component YafN of YafNO toxin-antitoxin module